MSDVSQLGSPREGFFSYLFFLGLVFDMPKNLSKQARKQQSRIAALNTLGTPASSRAGSELEDELDTLSEASFATADSTGEIDETRLEDTLRRQIDDLGEKRTATRETALGTLNQMLAHHYCGPFLGSNQSNLSALLQLLIRSVRKPGSTQETILALKGIGLAFLSQEAGAGGEQDDYYGLVLPLLKNLVLTAVECDVKYQAIETLAMVTFLAASHADTMGGLDFFYKILISQGDNLRSEDEDTKLSNKEMHTLMDASTRAYGLLYASAFGDGRGTYEDAWDEWQAVMPAHLDLLEHSSKDVRVAAGENIALMFECTDTLKKQQVVEEDEQEDEDQIPDYEEMDELIDALQRLATDSSKKVNKQDRKEQRGAFRDIIRTVESNERPKETLRFGRFRLVFRGWANILELRAFRHWLGQGLVRHFHDNDTVYSVFARTVNESSDSEGEADTEDGPTAFEEEGSENVMVSKNDVAARREKAKRIRKVKGH
ncbi:interferon-related developmental regulator-domain-containing protein [Radiomyces spectabilis]|uniref:interferon-related developmental regulator-domain-containing protein n=1 Tax=Radiomyces spectabilis TaxID=64574 RepID=UPI0022205057|nr:interferon-related developmental regulator-domain-containing protein [Radiomyces spectabilis]KAI8364652.1 interferon-related developmental regulator-domain-containing protein [Radiomyces spectabilis]